MTARPLAKSRYASGDIIVGKYLLTEPLGRGGMGEVWEAMNIRLHAPVAIKVIKSELADEISRERLLFEARVAAKLAHPAIIKIFDVGETEREEPYVVMERLRGETLRDILDDGRRNLTLAVQAMIPILDALTLAHSEGLVHRDVKPDNIFLARTGARTLQPKLLDFGVVKGPQYDRQLTLTGTVVGSPPYMSPEQARGEREVDFHADLWAVSVILYEFATGQLPFDADNYNALLRRIVEEEAPRVPARNEALATLGPIINKGLAKDRSERWLSAETYAIALAEWLLSRSIDVDLVGSRLTGRWPVLPRFETPRVSDTSVRSSYVSLAADRSSSAPAKELEGAPTISAQVAAIPLHQSQPWQRRGLVAGALILLATVFWIWPQRPAAELAQPVFDRNLGLTLTAAASGWRPALETGLPPVRFGQPQLEAEDVTKAPTPTSAAKRPRTSAPQKRRPPRKDSAADLGLKNPY